MKRIIAPALAVLVFSSATVALAIVAKRNVTHKFMVLPEAHVLRPKLDRQVAKQFSFGKTAALRKDTLTKVPRVLSGKFDFNIANELSATPSLKVIAARASTWILAHPELFALHRAADLELDLAATLVDKTDQFLKFRIFRDGVKVLDASIDLRFKRGELVQIVNYSFGEVAVAKAMTKADTKAFASTHFTAVKFIAPLLRVFTAQGRYVAIPVDRYAVDHNGEPYFVDIQQAKAKVIAAQPRRFYAGGHVKADIYRRYYKDDVIEVPLEGVGIDLGPGMFAFSDADGNFEANLDSQPFVEGLKSKIVEVRNQSGDLIKRSGTLSGEHFDLHVKRQDNAESFEDKDLAQNMIYVHTQWMVNFAQRYLDIPWFSRRLVANANLSSTCNAHWDGATINFYSADEMCANTGLISDVVYHEWGHGLDENTGGIEDGAYSEGFGDIMSLIMTRSNILGIGFKLDGGFVRDLEPDLSYPKDQGEVHHEGLIIGGTFYDLFKILSAKHGADTAVDLLSRYAFKGIVAASRYTDVYDALLVIDDNDANLENGTPNFCAINEAFTLHGLSEVNSRCQLGQINDGGPVQIIGNSNGVMEPGESFAISPVLYNNTGGIIDGLSAQLALEHQGIGIQIDRNTLSWPTIDAEGRAASQEKVIVQIAADTQCGASTRLNIDAKTSEREAKMHLPLQIGRLDAHSDAFQAEHLPIEIPDQGQIEALVTVKGEQWTSASTVLTARLAVDITHTYSGDVKVSLQSPTGELIPIAQGAGDAEDFKFDADISDKLAGKLGTGDWKIVVQDTAPQDVGTLNSASLTLTPARYVCESVSRKR